MKNLPDKLYILHHEDYSDRRIFNAFTEKESNTDIEYIRKDAFVEKVSLWIEENIKKWYENIRVHGFRGMTPLMIIELKKYMKGE